MGLEDLQQHLYNIQKFHAILSYPVPNQRAHHAWAPRKMFNIRLPKWTENAMLGVLALNRI